MGGAAGSQMFINKAAGSQINKQSAHVPNLLQNTTLDGAISPSWELQKFLNFDFICTDNEKTSLRF